MLSGFHPTDKPVGFRHNFITEEYKGQYAEVEVYQSSDMIRSLHSDFITCISASNSEELYENLDVAHHELMDEKAYNESILANSCESADFETWYNDKDAKVLVVIVK